MVLDTHGSTFAIHYFFIPTKQSPSSTKKLKMTKMVLNFSQIITEQTSIIYVNINFHLICKKQ